MSGACLATRSTRATGTGTTRATTPPKAVDQINLRALRTALRKLRTESPGIWKQILLKHGNEPLVDFVQELEGEYWGIVR